MKKLNIGISATLPLLMVLFACTKTPNVAPTPDTELQTSIDASYATFLVSDVEMICSVMGEDDSGSRAKFYEPSATSQGTTTVIRNTQTKRLSYTFNNTTCRDGRVRDGSVWMFFAEQTYATHTLTGNESYTRDYNFTGRITLEEYKVDDWLVDNKDYENSNPFTNNTTVLLRNLRPDNKTPLPGNLTWHFEGGFTMKKNLDSMAWKGTWTKTLENTKDPKVFAASTQSAIQWPLAIISYTGEAKGITPGNKPYKIKYYKEFPLKRNFTCFPDVIASATTAPAPTNSLITYKSEFHPFISGVASFTTTDKYPREIYYDNQQTKYGSTDSPVALPAQCDNKGVVQIKGNFYTIDLKK
jgi:hypothetical protein